MNENKELLVFGEVLFDCFEDGSTVLGGAPFNVAWHLQAFGCSPLFISRIGDDRHGEIIRASMQQWGMDTSGLQQDPDHPTGTVEVSLQDGEPSYDIVAERAWDFIDTELLPDADPGLLYHGSLALRHPRSAAALQALKDRGSAAVFLDVNLRPPWWEASRLESLVADATWVKLNEHELQTLAHGDSSAAGIEGLRSRARELIDRYQLKLVIVTRGAAGAFALDGNGGLCKISPDIQNSVIDTVGAGDAFTSVCILGLVRGWEVDTILPRAQAFASAIVGRRGATIDDRAFYQDMLQQWGIQG